MATLNVDSVIGVIGAGTMGAGIAQVAAAAGHPVVLFDVADGAAENGLKSIRSGLEKLIERGKMTLADVNLLCERITPADSLQSLQNAHLVIEAIVENLEVKRTVFAELESICSEHTIIASNTSSISISALAAKLAHPERLLGMHFFNPAAVLKLVEVISGVHTSPAIADEVFQAASAWGKTPVHAKSTPGFIVNRIARPFYAEALRSLNEQAASVATIDAVARDSGGFRMGPFQLMDLIGQDINLAVSESVYAAYYGDKRFQPSVLQAEMVAGGLLGRKTGKGHYDYSASEQPQADYLSTDSRAHSVVVRGDFFAAAELTDLLEKSPLTVTREQNTVASFRVGDTHIQLSDGRTASTVAAQLRRRNVVLFDLALDYGSAETVAIAVAEQADQQALQDAVAFFTCLGKRVCQIKDLPGMVLLRTVCCLINEAADAINQGVCKVEDVDVAMMLGVNYPLGPIGWADRLGYADVVSTLGNLQASYGEERYRCSVWLQNKQYERS